MNKVNKKPPEIEITVTVKFDEKIKYRRQVINLAAEEADADVTFSSGSTGCISSNCCL